MARFIRIYKFAAPAFVLLLLVGIIGCDWSGGGSGSWFTGPKEPSPLTVDSVQFGSPISSTDGEGAVDGPLFNTNIADIVICVDSNNPTGYMSVWMQVNVSGGTISHYDWEIVGWQNQEPFGYLSHYDEPVDIDDDLGVYKVRSYGNKVRYDSTRNFLIPSNHNELIKVTAWTVDGHFTTAFFHLLLTADIATQSYINVKDYGAIGNGIVDDTAAVQAALTALEQSTTTNVLFFPSGTYFLDTVSATTGESISKKELVHIGTLGLQTNRSITICGEADSVLYTAGSERKDTLVVHTAFRSVTIKDLRFEKDATLLAAVRSEPNGQNAIMFTPAGFNEVQSLVLDNLDIVNCHRSFTIGYAWGNLYEGLIKDVWVTNCRFTSPYGSCDSDILRSYGGGQMTYMNAWVDTAYYMNNYFSGGTDNYEAVDYSWLDGSHFGCPHELIFVGNDVENFGIEAVFHTGYEVVLGYSTESLVVPASNGVDTVDIVLPSHAQNDNFTLGDGVTLYADQTTLAVFEIVGWDKPTETLTVVNNGWEHNPAPGATIPVCGRIKLSNSRTDSASTTLTGNYINSRDQAVVLQNTAQVYGNTIEGFVGVLVTADMSYTHMMRASGSVISGNRIDLHRASNSLFVGTAKGIIVQQPDGVISDNIITSGLTNRVVGISADSRGIAVLNNKLKMLNPADNSPINNYRCAGIQVSCQFNPIRGGTVTNVVVSGNFTEGFDLAVGATLWGGDVDIFCPVHYSTNDAMVFDLGNSLLHF